MANYSITYSCGHTAEKQLYGKHAERERYVEWAARSGQCAACAATEKQAACESTEAGLELPALIGSEKQVDWARRIRAEKFGEIEAFLAAALARVPADKMDEYERQRAAVMQRLYARVSAHWWIDHRNTTGSSLAKSAYKETL